MRIARRRFLRTLVPAFAAVLAPGVITVLAASLLARYGWPMLFLYFPPLLVLAYVAGATFGIACAAISAALANVFFIGPVGLAFDTASNVITTLLFFLTGVLIAVTGAQARRYQLRLRSDLESLAVLDTLLTTAPVGLAFLDRDLRYVRINPTLAERNGLPVEAHLGRRVRDVIPAVVPLVEPVMRRVIETGRAVTDLELTAEAPADGSLRHWLASYYPVRAGGDGSVLGVGVVVLDITERKRSEERIRRRAETQRLLAEASKILASTLDYETTLRNVARLAVEAVADWCAVYMTDADGTVRRLEVAHADPRRAALVAELTQRYPFELDRWPTIKAVFDTGRSQLFAEIDEGVLRSAAHDEEHLAVLHGLGQHSAMLVPIVVRDRVVGAIGFAAGEARPRYTEEDLAQAEELARRAATAIEHARLFAAERTARQEAEAAAQRLNALNRLIAIAASALDLGAVFDEFARVLQTLVPFLRLTVSLHQADRDWLTMPYFFGPTLGVGPQQLEGPRAGTARGQVIDHGRPFIREDSLAQVQFTEDAQLGRVGVRSYIIVPMVVAGRVIGTLNLGHTDPGFYTPDHAGLLQPVAHQLGLAVSRYQLFDQVQRRAGELSETLQRALLPADLPVAPFTAISAAYRAADPEAKIGGDWYDALLVPGDRIMVSIGDVTGHGVPAAAAMGQVRHIVRAYALEERTPGEILEGLNRFLGRLPESLHLSLWIAVLDPISGEVVYSGAGHPPVLVLEDGETAFLPSDGPPLGVFPDLRYADRQTRLHPGARIIAYTDGLIEITKNILEGEQRLLASAVATRADAVSPAVDALLEQVVDGIEPHDDIALLVLDLLPATTPVFFSVPATPSNLRRVRWAVRAFAERHGLHPELRDAMVTAAGEAALNVVEHAYRGATGAMLVRGERENGTLWITVSDSGQWRPQVERGRGRGTVIMQALADEVHTQTGPSGTVVELRWSISEPVPSTPEPVPSTPAADEAAGQGIADRSVEG